MKELQRFRQFLTENVSPEALIKVYEEEIVNAEENEQEFEIPAYEKGIEMLKKGGNPEEVNDHVQGLLMDITGDYYDPTVLMDKAKALSEGEEEIKEDDRISTGQSIERQLQALEDLQMAIEELQMSGVFDEGNDKAMKLLDQAYMMLYKALDVEGSLK